MNDERRTKKTIMSDMVAVSRPKKPDEKPQPAPAVKPAVQKTQAKAEPVRETVAASEDKKAPARSGCGLWMVTFFCALALALVIGGFIATATVAVTPKKFTGAVDASVTLSEDNELGTLRFFTATEQFSEDRVVPSQATVGQDAFAAGSVRFYNASAQPVTLPAQTVIETPDPAGHMLQYQTKNAITVPKTVGTKPGQKDVGVVAVAAGSDSNVSLSDFTLVTPVPNISAHSVSELTGGAEKSDKVADAALIVAAQNDLLQNYSPSSDFTSRLLQQLPSDMIALPITFTESTPTVTVDTHFDDGVHVIATTSVTVTMVKRADVARFLGDQLNVPKGISLTLPDLSSLSVTTTTLASPGVVPTNMPVRITGNVTVFGAVNQQDIQRYLAGESRGQAATYLSAIAEIQSHTIHMMPFWRTIFPLDSGKIMVKLINP